jgi:uncharacterized protein with HEPN domain
MRRDAERLADIVEAAEKTAARVGKGREAFNADEDMQIVLVHLIQIIGEAAAGVSENLIVANPEVPWRQIIAMRNRVVHGYFEVDLNILWDVAIGDLPLSWAKSRQYSPNWHRHLPESRLQMRCRALMLPEIAQHVASFRRRSCDRGWTGRSRLRPAPLTRSG